MSGNDEESPIKRGPGRPRGSGKREVFIPERITWTIAECALACGVAPVAIYRAAKKGELRVCKIGRKVIRILPCEAHAWLVRCLVDTLPMNIQEGDDEDSGADVEEADDEQP